MLVGETRLQDTITGPARATVTSVLGLLEEVVALATYVGFALGSRVLGFPSLVALLGLPALLVAAAVAHWLPPPAGVARILRSTDPRPNLSRSGCSTGGR